MHPPHPRGPVASSAAGPDAVLGALLSATRDVVCTLDLDQRVTGLYGRAVEEPGLRVGDVLGCVPGPARARALAGETADWEWSAGAECYPASVAPIRDAAGAVRGLLVVRRAAAPRRAAATERQRVDAQFAAVIESALDGIVCVDGDERIRVFNPAAERLLGCSAAEAVGQPIERFIPERYRRAHRNEVRRFAASEDSARVMGAAMSIHALRADGTRLPIEATISQVRLGDESLLTIIFRDVTERLEAEQRLRLLSRAIEQSPVSVVVADAQGRIAYVNPQFTVATGYTEEEVLGRNPRVLKSGAHDASFYRELWGTLLSGRTWVGRFENRRKDGSLLRENACIAPVMDPHGKVTHYVAVKEDVTEQEHLAEQLRQSQRLEAVGQLAGGVAHDFNNLLTVIQGYGTLLELALPEGTEERDHLGQIQAAARRSADLTRQLLAFSRRQILRPRELDIGEIVTGLERMLRRVIGEDIALQTEIAPDLHTVSADPGQVEQVLMNLCVNARDAMPEGGHLTVRAHNRRLSQAQAASLAPEVAPGDYVELEVADEGMGMGEELLARIFDPFFTTKEVGQGTGLGLSTVYGIVRQSRGCVWAESEPGRGSTFHVLLPRLAAAGAPARSEAPEPGLPGARPRARGTVLLVEDDGAVRELLVRTLRHMGYAVVEAPDGPAALALVRTMDHPVDLALVDVVMPRMSGRELGEHLHRRWADLPVVFMSGYTDDAVLRHGIAYQDAHFLAKPIQTRELDRTLRELLAPGA